VKSRVEAPAHDGEMPIATIDTTVQDAGVEFPFRGLHPVSEPRTKRARKAEGFYAQVKRRRTKAEPRAQGGAHKIVHMEKVGTPGGPLKNLIRVGPQLISRIEASTQRVRATRGIVYDDMG